MIGKWPKCSNITLGDEMKTEEKHRTKKAYGLKDQERLDRDPETVIADLFDGTEIEDYTFPVEVYVFEPLAVKVRWDGFLEDILERLDEEYADPEGNIYSQPTEKMEKAAKVFAEVIEKEYTSWQCEPTGEIIKYFKKDIPK